MHCPGSGGRLGNWRVKALVVADIHYALTQFEWLLGRAGRYELIVIAGDLLDLASPVDPDVQILVVTRYLERLSDQTAVAVCSGNHDGDVRTADGVFEAEWLQELRCRQIEGLHVDGETFSFGPDKITLCPWWEGDVSRDRMAAMLRNEATAGSRARRWIWVHHAPPDDCPVSWTGRVFGGDQVLNELIAELQPDLVFSGHIHNAPFYAEGDWVTNLGGTWVFNPGHQIGPIPAFISIDLDTLDARYRNLEDADHRMLTARAAEGAAD